MIFLLQYPDFIDQGIETEMCYILSVFLNDAVLSF